MNGRLEEIVQRYIYRILDDSSIIYRMLDDRSRNKDNQRKA